MKELENIGADEFLRQDKSEHNDQINTEYLFLLPSIISRIEYALVDFMLGKKMLLRDKVRIGVIERDLACADWGLVSFIDRLHRLMQLYGVQVNIPTIELVLSRDTEQPEIDKIID